jgi:hypothetical protein
MTWSTKAADLLRDLRFALHSAVTGPDCGDGELKLHGSALEAGPELRGAAAAAWWSAWAGDKAIVFALRIGQAVFIGWDIEHGLMIVRRWSPQAGCRQTSRTYP